MEGACAIAQEPGQQIGVDAKLMVKGANRDWNEGAAAEEFDRHASIGRKKAREALLAADYPATQTLRQFDRIHHRAKFIQPHGERSWRLTHLPFRFRSRWISCISG